MKIAQFGTFDVENYGDLLFPKILEKRLEGLGELVFVSPIGGAPVWRDCVASVSFDEFRSSAAEFAGLVIGGGNIVHASTTTLPSYQQRTVPLTGYADLWLGPLEFAARGGAAALWNAPGVAEALPENLASLVRDRMKHARYLSVRDRSSRDLLASAGIASPIAVVPDTALDVTSVWSPTELESEYHRFLVERNLDAQEDLIVFHAKRRYGQGGVEVMAEGIRGICEHWGATPVLLAIGPCHGDDAVAREVGECLGSNAVVVERPGSLKRVTALLASSRGYVGSSLHGAIVATAFGRPVFVVASRQTQKFQGFLEPLGLDGQQVDTWSEALHERSRALQAPDVSAELAVARKCLDSHFSTLRELLKEAGERHAGHSWVPELAYRSGVLEAAGLRLLHEREEAREEGKRTRLELRETQGALSESRQAHGRAQNELTRSQSELSKLGKQFRDSQLRAKKRFTEHQQSHLEDLETTKTWVERLTGFVERMEKSRSWRLGKALWRVMRSLRLTRKKPSRSPRRAREILREMQVWYGRRIDRWQKREAAAAKDWPENAPPGGHLIDFAGRITVLIPVYDAVEAVERCVDSVLASTKVPHRLLLVNDASPDPRVAPLLASYEQAHGHVKVVTNERNLGFTRTVCRGFEESGNDDVVILNSDTVVPRGWLARLSTAAYHRDRIATVTPLSNAAGAFSVPVNHQINQVPEELGVEGMDALVEELSERRWPQVPTANGFCCYLRRDAWVEVGGFDPQNFPRGYGEENDYSMRAAAAGWVNVVDDTTFVFHERSASFGETKNELAEAGKKRLQELHPDYKKKIREWLQNDPVDPLRAKLTQALESKAPPTVPTTVAAPRGAILYVIHDGGGGSVLTNLDLVREVSRDRRCLLLRADLNKWSLDEVQNDSAHPVEEVAFENRWGIQWPLDEPRRLAFSRILREQGVSLVHFRGLIGTDPQALAIAREAGCRTILSFHDSYLVCPTVGLVNNRGEFCAGRCNNDADDCQLSKRWFPGLPRLKNGFVHEWRRRVAEGIPEADAYVVTTESARRLVSSYYPVVSGRRLHVIEHGRDLAGYQDSAEAPGEGPMGVVFFGALGHLKGPDLVQELVERNQREGSPFEFHILGDKAASFQPEKFGAHVHGPYQRDELPRSLAKIQPSVALVPSRCSETYCHTLTEAWAAGLPVLGSHLGAVRDRIQAHGGGWILDPHDANSWYETLLRLRQHPEEWQAKKREVDALSIVSLPTMVARYQDLYRSVEQGAERQDVLTPENGIARGATG